MVSVTFLLRPPRVLPPPPRVIQQQESDYLGADSHAVTATGAKLTKKLLAPAHAAEDWIWRIEDEVRIWFFKENCISNEAMNILIDARRSHSASIVEHRQLVIRDLEATCQVQLTNNRWFTDFVEGHAEVFNYEANMFNIRRNKIILSVRLAAETGENRSRLIREMIETESHFQRQRRRLVQFIRERLALCRGLSEDDDSNHGTPQYVQYLTILLTKFQDFEAFDDSLYTKDDIGPAMPAYEGLGTHGREMFWYQLFDRYNCVSFYYYWRDIVAVEKMRQDALGPGFSMAMTFVRSCCALYEHVIEPRISNSNQLRAFGYIAMPEPIKIEAVYAAIREVGSAPEFALRMDQILVNNVKFATQ